MMVIKQLSRQLMLNVTEERLAETEKLISLCFKRYQCYMRVEDRRIVDLPHLSIL